MAGFLEKSANIAVIIGVVVFLGVVVRREFFPPQAPPDSVAAVRDALKGKQFRPPGMSFPLQRGTVLLAVSSTCHFCKESWPFYRELAQKAQGKVDLVALLPQPQADAEAYMKEAGVPALRVVSANLSTLGVPATPTLLWLDPNGTVREVWVGFLDDARQKQVLSQVLAN